MFVQKSNGDILSASAPTHRSDLGNGIGDQNGCDYIVRRGGTPLTSNMYSYQTQVQPIQYLYPITQNLAPGTTLSAPDNYAYQCTMSMNYNTTMRTISYPNVMPLVSVPQHNPTVYMQTAQPQYFQMAYPQPFVYSHAPIMEQRNYTLLKQIEFYFSPLNLKNDTFIRSRMNSEGYIPLILVTGFPRVQAITNDLFLIGQVLRRSTEVELSPDGLQVRPRKDWKQWPLSSSSSESLKSAS